MPTGIMLVESRPISFDDISEFHRWYDEVHIPAILAVEGFVSARRLQTEDGTSFVALYEIDTDIATAKANLRAAFFKGHIDRPTVVQLDPPPVQQYFQTIDGSTSH
jgi:hypothetical protein